MKFLKFLIIFFTISTLFNSNQAKSIDKIFTKKVQWGLGALSLATGLYKDFNIADTDRNKYYTINRNSAAIVSHGFMSTLMDFIKDGTITKNRSYLKLITFFAISIVYRKFGYWFHGFFDGYIHPREAWQYYEKCELQGVFIGAFYGYGTALLQNIKFN